jgi:uncharacterized DUF497 family protein
MAPTRFEWDENKDRANRRKHGISFETAARVFLDPNAIMRHDRDIAGERRWQTIGSLDNRLMVVLVAHTLTDDDNGALIRIVSARKATPVERRIYEEGEYHN